MVLSLNTSKIVTRSVLLMSFFVNAIVASEPQAEAPKGAFAKMFGAVSNGFASGRNKLGDLADRSGITALLQSQVSDKKDEATSDSSGNSAPVTTSSADQPQVDSSKDIVQDAITKNVTSISKPVEESKLDVANSDSSVAGKVDEAKPLAVTQTPKVNGASQLNSAASELSKMDKIFEMLRNKYVIGSAVAACVLVAGVVYYWATTSWKHQVQELVQQAAINPDSIVEELAELLSAWDGSSVQQDIIEYVENNVEVTSALASVLEYYRK